MVGTFLLALDFFLFYVFWEVMLLPMYFLIGVWGGPRREYAAIKFFLYTASGSVFILIALLAFYFTNIQDVVNSPKPKDSFDLILLQKAGRQAANVCTTSRTTLWNKPKSNWLPRRATKKPRRKIGCAMAARRHRRC